MEFERSKEFQRNRKLEDLLKEINELLGPVEVEAVSAFEKNEYPLILIMGNARSGTTLMLQWLAGLGHFGYPTNILSRFYGAPYVGAKIQLMLTKYDHKGEIFDLNEEMPFASHLGKTKGALAPNEFWYFWRRFFRFEEIQRLDDSELEKVDHKRFIAEIAALEEAFGKPFAMKGMIINWNIPYMARIVEKVLFIYMERHPLYNIQSLLAARKQYYGDIRAWYSFKPPEYEALKERDPYEQVAGQIYYTNQAVKEGLSAIDEKKHIRVSYEKFCQNPEAVFEQVKEKLRAQGVEADLDYRGPEAFESTNRVQLAEDEKRAVIRAYKALTGETLDV